MFTLWCIFVFCGILIHIATCFANILFFKLIMVLYWGYFFMFFSYAYLLAALSFAISLFRVLFCLRICIAVQVRTPDIRGCVLYIRNVHVI